MAFSVTQTQFQSRGAVCHYGELCNDNEVVLSWVYDCGKKAFIQQIPSNRDLDFIFVSHFDADHVNSIADLKIGKNTQIFIPYVPAPLFLVLLFFYLERYSISGRAFIKGVYEKLVPLWNERRDINESMNIPENLFSYYFDDSIIQTDLLFSNMTVVGDKEEGISLSNGTIPWEFYVSSYIDTSFISAVQQLANNIISQKTPRVRLLKTGVKMLKSQYCSINYRCPQDDIKNIISMCVYSGPTRNNTDINIQNTGWIHTGDSCFHHTAVLNYFLNVFQGYIPRTHVLSLAHHGSNKTNTNIVLGRLFANFSNAEVVIPYSTAVKKCCHRNQSFNSVYCTENQDVSFVNSSSQAIKTVFPCPNCHCKIF